MLDSAQHIITSRRLGTGKSSGISLPRLHWGKEVPYGLLRALATVLVHHTTCKLDLRFDYHNESQYFSDTFTLFLPNTSSVLHSFVTPRSDKIFAHCPFVGLQYPYQEKKLQSFPSPLSVLLLLIGGLRLPARRTPLPRHTAAILYS
jgi:hypothetical protein